MQHEQILVDHPVSTPGLGLGWPRMRYGDLEALLMEVTGGDKRSVLGRFRNIRQMPFPDAIKSGTGNPVEYDLPRVLAICAAFEINALLIPQSHAVAIVRDNWPELARGFIAGAVELGVAAKPGDMPKGLSAVVAILPDGFGADGGLVATATNLPSKVASGAAMTQLRVDCAALMGIVMPRLERIAGGGGAELAFGDLDRSFGWSGGSIPHRGTVADMFSGSSFLDRGPYLERAAEFLRVAATLPRKEDEGPVRSRSAHAAQHLLDYLGRPAPIDEWKGEIGTEPGRPRLKHFLAAVGSMAGLKPPVHWHETVLATTGGSPGEGASALIERAAAIEKARSAGSVANSAD